ncbi:hypothetical protein M3Y97_00033100 [Aphelenchoides bicaudatus]|nr:hypothetical protein M3Y97_00033100 [Aphelenchoides bicaudatus]
MPVVVPCIPQIGFRAELLSPVQLNRASSSSGDNRLLLSHNSAFAQYQRRSTTPTNGLQPRNGLEKSQSSAAVIFSDKKESEPIALKPFKMDSFHELHIDIPLNEYLNSEPNSSTITPSPKPDVIPESEFSTLKQSQFPKPPPFIELVSPSSPPIPPKRVEPEKSKHFKEILSLFQNAANSRQLEKRPRPHYKPRRFDSLDETSDRSDRSSSSDSSLHKFIQLKMPRSTTTVSTASKTQTHTLITEHLSEEEDRGIVKDIAFQNNHKRLPMLKNTSSLLSIDVKALSQTRLYNHQPIQLDQEGRKLSVEFFIKYIKMATSHSSTLAFVSENFSKMLREFSPLPAIGREIFENACLSNIVFKSTTPVFIKDKIAIFDAAFIASNYMEYPISVLILPAGQYAPLLGRHAERSGFGPSVLAEFEELEVELRHFLQESGFDQKPMSSLRILIMPPINVCSLQSLAAHYTSKNLNVNKCEEHVCFVMIQLLSALKCLQSDGVEQLSNNFKEFILSYANPDNKSLLQTIDQLPRLMLLKDTIDDYNEDQLSVLNGFNEDAQQTQNLTVGICKFALRALCILLNRKFQGSLPEIPERTRFSTPLRKCAQILDMDRSNSMSEAKQILEFAFFANGHNFESEYEAKLWLDERRAQFVSQLVRFLIQREAEITSPRQQMYLVFLALLNSSWPLQNLSSTSTQMTQIGRMNTVCK